MADTIKIGNLDISSFKVGSDDCKIYLGDTLLYPFVPKDYLRFEVVSSGTFTFTAMDTNSANTVDYSLDSGQTWSTIGNGQSTPTVSSGEYIYWRGSDMTTESNKGIGRFAATGNFNIEGNIMSLLYGNNFEGQTNLSNFNSAFQNLFSGNTYVIDASKLELPATTLFFQVYTNMFSRASNLTAAPSLTAATTLATGCYYNMFYNCTSLLTSSSYMLPAATLVENCYRQMFYGCSKVTKITCLATSGINTNNSTANWLAGNSQSGVLTRANSSVSWPSGNSGKPSKWSLANYS